MHMMGSTFQEIGASRILTRRVLQRKAEREPKLAEKINGKWIFEHAKAGDPDCVEAIDEMTDALGMGIANICYVLNPQVVVAGRRNYGSEGVPVWEDPKGNGRYLIPAVSEHHETGLR